MAWSTTPRRVVRLPVWIRRSSQVLMAEWSQILWGWIARWFSLYATYSCASVNDNGSQRDAMLTPDSFNRSHLLLRLDFPVILTYRLSSHARQATAKQDARLVHQTPRGSPPSTIF